jgi:hypothetical protein
MHFSLAELALPVTARPPVYADRRTLALFAYDWSALGFRRQSRQWHCTIDHAGFNLHAFPSNLRLVGFDVRRYADQLAQQARKLGQSGVVSTHEQFGALAAALLAERMGWPGTPVRALLACQHKLYARDVLEQVAPEANIPYAPLQAGYHDDIPHGLRYPLFAKPIKAAFSVLAARMPDRAALQAHTRFGYWEAWVIRRLVEPFDAMARQMLGTQRSAHGLMLEEPVDAPQYNLDGYVYQGDVRAVGVVDAHMYPGTQAFMRFELPSRLPQRVQARALDVARRFLGAVGFTHGQFNMEFFYDDATDRLSVIEFNPRMASQFSDLYLRVKGVDLHAIALALAHGQDPAELPQSQPLGGAAASLVYRTLSPHEPFRLPDARQREALQRVLPHAWLFTYPKGGRGRARDFKWLGSYRFGIVQLHGHDAEHLQRCSEVASRLLGWKVPYGPKEMAPALQRPAPAGAAWLRVA